MRRWLALLALAACDPHGGARTPGAGPAAEAYIEHALRPWAGGVLAVTDPDANRFAVYDSALAALVLLRRGDRDQAGHLLVGLSALQTADGGLPFSFTPPAPDPTRYVRSGAVAWVGYAAAEYIDADEGGRDREVALRVAHGAASYLLARQIHDPTDLRDGLVRGGEGTLRYETTGTPPHQETREIIEPADIPWTSVEHNVDAYFFLRALARATGETPYAEAADAIGRALVSHAWRADAGQLARGVDRDGPDRVLALDCAAWGSVLLRALGSDELSRASIDAANRHFASRDPRSHARGYLPYASGPLLEDPQLQAFYLTRLPAPSWDRLSAVWPEGSAGVAFAELRAGHRDRAVAILDALEPLRLASGALPTFTVDVPFTFDTQGSIAGTAWVELVRYELERGPDRPTLWVP